MRRSRLAACAAAALIGIAAYVGVAIDDMGTPAAPPTATPSPVTALPTALPTHGGTAPVPADPVAAAAAAGVLAWQSPTEDTRQAALTTTATTRFTTAMEGVSPGVVDPCPVAAVDTLRVADTAAQVRVECAGGLALFVDLTRAPGGPWLVDSILPGT